MHSSAPENKEKVLLRIRQASEFPAMANTVNLVNQFKESEDSTVSDLANIILKDYALTTKVLKVVNSVHYHQSGEVTTISRAIFLLGFESVKSIALTLMLFDRLRKSSSNSELIDVLVQSFCGSIIAEKIVRDLNFIEEEEAFICTLLHPFGKIMVAFSMPGKVSEIKALGAEKNVSEDAAARAVLGISYEEIGTTIAREWNFPQKIIDGMRHVTPSSMTSNPGESEKLGSIATFSAEISNILAAGTEKEEKESRLKDLVQSYGEHFGTVGGKLDGIIGSSLQELSDFAGVMNINVQDNQISRQAGQWARDKKEEARDIDILAYRTDSLKTIDAFLEAEDSPENIFSKGIQDINNAMFGSYSLNDIIRIALETMYRSLQTSMLSRALFFVRNTKEPTMDVRLGFGAGIEELKKWFIIPISAEGDIFSIAVTRHNDLIMRDLDAPDISKFVPHWYRGHLSGPSFAILLPLTINKRNIGLYYLDGKREGFKDISKGQFNYLRILRDQTVLAIKQLRG